MKEGVGSCGHELIAEFTANFSQVFQLDLILVLEERILFNKRDDLIQVSFISRFRVLLKNSNSIIENLILRENLLGLPCSSLALFGINGQFLLFIDVVEHVA